MVADFVLAQLGGLAEQPSFDLDGVEPLRASFVEDPPERPTALADLLERLQPAIAKSYNTAGPGYLAYIPGGGVYAAALADFVACAVNRCLWVHADAAYGGFFRLVPEAEARLRGIEDCDSITLDPHKSLFLPYGLGALLVRDGEALARVHREGASYVQDVTHEGSLGFADLSPELSRDFRGLRLWLPLMLHGLAAFREQLEEKLALARWAYRELAGDPHFEVLDEPQLSVVAFRLRAPASAADRLGPELLRRVNGRKRVFLSSTELRGRYALRLCVLSFRTHAERVEDAVLALRQEAQALLGR
jgi:aromatic-L-amino-acid decarboxylase